MNRERDLKREAHGQYAMPDEREGVLVYEVETNTADKFDPRPKIVSARVFQYGDRFEVWRWHHDCQLYNGRIGLKPESFCYGFDPTPAAVYAELDRRAGMPRWRTDGRDRENDELRAKVRRPDPYKVFTTLDNAAREANRWAHCNGDKRFTYEGEHAPEPEPRKLRDGCTIEEIAAELRPLLTERGPLLFGFACDLLELTEAERADLDSALDANAIQGICKRRRQRKPWWLVAIEGDTRKWCVDDDVPPTLFD